MSTPHPEPNNRRSQPVDGPRSVRWRLWAAMLALALVPAAACVYLTDSLASSPDAGLANERARETTEAAAALLAREQGIEARLLVAATDPSLGRLADGISGARDRQLVERVLSRLRGDDGSIVAGACITRSADGVAIPLTARGHDTGACADASLQRRSKAARSDSVMRTTTGSGAAQRLILATPLRSVPERHDGVLSAEVDVAALFGRTHLSGQGADSSMLVDMGSTEIVAAAVDGSGPAGAGVVDAAALEHYVEQLRGGADAAELMLMGGLPTVVPLWGNGDGTRMALVQVWPPLPMGMPLEVRIGLVLLISGVIVAVILLVRYFLDPFQEMADDRAELQVLYKEAREDALADGLTGLGNHRAFQEELARQATSFERRSLAFSLVLMDLDDMKVVNDREGHAAGDEMLVSMAETMREMSRPGDKLFRTGGDEFAMILPNTSIEQAVAVAERMLHFSKRPPAGGRSSAFSGGISGVPWFTRQRDTVYRQADAALYWVKRHGRGSVEVFDPQRDQLPDELGDATSNAVSQVVSGKLLRPVYQPIVDLRTGRILGFEGLIRPDPNGPLPDTGKLFAAAAATGRTVELDLACLETVVNGAKAIGPDRLLTLNISPRTLEVKDFDAAWLLSGLVRNGISPGRVIVEMTEREEVDDLGRLQQTFNLLQQYGLRLAADDVGAGNSGLRLLSQVQFDIVKIDLALVQSGVRRMGARAVLQSLRDLALSQNARIVAEGVETARQLQVIRELNIGAGQGYLLGRPDSSVEKTFVDVRQLESGLLVPPEAAHRDADERQHAADEEALEAISAERRAIFLPPARVGLEPSAGAA